MEILTILGKAFTSGLIAASAIIGVSAGPSYGDFNPTGGTTYRLSSSIGTTDTTIRLSSFKEPVSNIPYTMSYLGTDIGYGTLDPQNSRSEFISFTGITQNSNGTASLTGVTRGLARSPGASSDGCTTASSTLRQSHSGQSIFILSDSPCFFNEYAVKQNDETITGDWLVPNPVNPTSIANKQYVDGQVFGGIGNASETATGTVEIATLAEAAAGTTNGSLGRLALPSSLSTSTWTAAATTGNIPTLGAGGKLDSFFISTSTLYDFVFPAADGSANQTLVTDGSGSVSWAGYSRRISGTVTQASISNAASTTIFAATIPAGTLGTGNGLRLTFYDLTVNQNGSTYNIQAAYGNASTSLYIPQPNPGTRTDNSTIEFTIMGDGTTSTQYGRMTYATSTFAGTAGNFLSIATSTGAVASTQDRQLLLQVYCPDQACRTTYSRALLELIQN